MRNLKDYLKIRNGLSISACLDIPIFISHSLPSFLSSVAADARVATTSKKVHEFSCTNQGGGKITGGNNAIDWAGELARALREMDDISPGRPLRGAIR